LNEIAKAGISCDHRACPSASLLRESIGYDTPYANAGKMAKRPGVKVADPYFRIENVPENLTFSCCLMQAA